MATLCPNVCQVAPLSIEVSKDSKGAAMIPFKVAMLVVYASKR